MIIKKRPGVFKTIAKSGIIKVIVMLSFSTVSFAKNAESQEVLRKKINLATNKTSIREVLAQIEQRANVQFTYVSNILSPETKISIQNPTLTLEAALQQILAPQNIQYEVIGNQIVLKKGTSTEKSIQQTISGKIVDEQGLPVVGATILEKGGTNNGTSSSSDGTFKLNAKIGSTLVVAMIGYQSQEITIMESTMTITLLSSENVLEDVVVVGYGTQRKSNVTGSIATVSGKTLEQSPTSNLTNAIAGNLPGVIAVNPNGTPGSGSNLQIRGLSTLNNNTALVVIDGVVRPDGFGNLDPNEIESLSVLKDAAAASVYGARAANGVFLITTKRGRSGKPNITYSGMMGIQNPTNYPELMSAYQFGSVRNKALLNQGYSPTNPAHAGFFYTDEEIADFQSRSNKNVWYDATFKKNALQSDHNVSISGGTETIKYFASVGTMDQDGMYDNINFKRYNFRSNLDAQVNKNLTIKLGLEGRQENKNNPGYNAEGIFRDVLRQNPTYKVYNPDGSYFNTNGEHPVAMYESSGYNNERWNVFQGTISFDHNLSFLTQGLSLNGMMSIYKDRLFHKTFFTPYTMYGVDNQGNIISNKLVGGETSLNQKYVESDQQTYNLSLNYDRAFGDHAIKGLLVYEEYKANGNQFNAYRQEFLSNIKDELFASGTKNQSMNGKGIISDSRRSVVGRVNYAYQDKYLLEGVFRYDGSYRFPSNNRWGFFPAVSAGWIISQESFFAESEALSFVSSLKLRASTGLVGNDRVNAFQFLDNYNIVSGSGPIIDGEAQPYIAYDVYPNQLITWEKQRSTNIGIDASFLQSKINWTLEYFKRNTYDILWKRERSVPGTFGRKLPSENYAKMDNHGWETSLAYRENIGQVTMDLNFNISYVVNKVTEIDDPINGLDYQRQKGKPYNFRAGYEADGLFRSQEEAANWYGGKQFGLESKAGDIRYKDLNGNGTIDQQDQKVISNYSNDPRMVYGFGGNFRWKGFDLAFLFQGTAMRNMMLEGTARVMYAGGGASGNFAYLADSWTPENPNAAYPLAWVDARGMNNRNSSFWLKDAGYIRLKNVNIGHTFNSTWLNAKGIDRIRLYVSGYNLLTWSQLKEFDPEISATNGAYYPQQRNFNLGINITL